MAASRTGALIVLEGSDPLEEIAATGISFNGRVASELLQSIFYSGTPLHDGAVIIRGDRVVAAGCVLPLTQQTLLAEKRLGTRHRAAVGMSGSYDLERVFEFRGSEDYYFATPMSFLPNLGGPLLDLLRRRFFILAYGGGRWENPDDSWRLAGILGSKLVPNRVDPWGPEYDHDWPTWRQMLPLYLDDLVA